MGRYALFIGTTTYQDPVFAKLTAPGPDVADFHRILTAPEVGGFESPPPHLDRPAAEVTRAIDRFLKGHARGDVLLLYFSGHGILDEEGRLHLVLTDSEHDLLPSTTVPASFVRDRMDACRSQSQILILDCCHSGAFGRSKGGIASSVGTTVAFGGTNQRLAGTGRVVLTASDATQFAFEGTEIVGDAKNSLFTHFLLEGLRSGEADLDGDGEITVDELYDFAHRKMSERTTAQTPNKWVFGQQGKVVVAKNPSPRARPELIPGDIVRTLESSVPALQTAAIQGLLDLAADNHPGRALAARSKLAELVSHDSRRLSDAAVKALVSLEAPGPSKVGVSSRSLDGMASAPTTSVAAAVTLGGTAPILAEVGMITPKAIGVPIANVARPVASSVEAAIPPANFDAGASRMQATKTKADVPRAQPRVDAPWIDAQPASASRGADAGLMQRKVDVAVPPLRLPARPVAEEPIHPAQEAHVQRSRSDAEAQARLEEMTARQEHERHIHALTRDNSKKRLKFLLVSLGVVVFAAAIVGGVAIKNQTDRTAATQASAAELRAQLDEAEAMRQELVAAQAKREDTAAIEAKKAQGEAELAALKTKDAAPDRPRPAGGGSGGALPAKPAGGGSPAAAAAPAQLLVAKPAVAAKPVEAAPASAGGGAVSLEDLIRKEVAASKK